MVPPQPPPPEVEDGGPLLGTIDAAKLARRSPATIRSWAHRGWLVPVRYDRPPGGHGKPRPMYRRDDVWEAEKMARERDDTARSARAVHTR